MSVQNNTPTLVLEGMTSISALIRSIESGKSNRQILEIRYDISKATKKRRELDFLKRKAAELQFSLLPSSADDICALTNGNTNGGIVALCTPRSFPELDLDAILPEGFYVLIDGIEDPYNFGYILRSLYAAGADGVVLPPRNWMNASSVVARASAGTSELFDVFVSDTEECFRLFREKGYRIVCAGIRDSVSLFEADLKMPLLLVVGGEKRGISAKLLGQCDDIVRIDYAREFKGSLTAATATAIMAFEIMRQNPRSLS